MSGAVVFLSIFAAAAGGSARAQPPRRQIGEKYALLIGVRQYDKNELRNLPYSEPDVTELAQVLKDSGYLQHNVVLMTQTVGADNSRFLPLAANIRKELRLLLRHRNRLDTVLVAFAGHGVQFKSNNEHYFCPMDAMLRDRSTLVSLSEVYRELENCRAGVRVLFVDACRNDPQADNSRARSEVDLESVTRPQQQEPPGGVAALFSCTAGQRAYEHDKLKHGVFFHFVIEGLRGKADLDKDRKVDLDGLVRFTKKQVLDFVRSEYGQMQTPELKGSVRGLVPLVNLNGPKKSWMGTMSADVGVSKRLGQERPSGALIELVVPDSPAAKAGLRKDDVVLKVNGDEIKRGTDFVATLNSHDPGEELHLDLLRGDNRQQVKVILAVKPTESELAWRYRQLAEEGEAVAQRNMGWRYATGQGVAQSDLESVKWYRKAAEQGDARAQNSLGWMYAKGRGVAENHAEAVKWYRKAAEQHFVVAQNNLALAYHLGHGVTKDVVEAVRWCRQAAEQGDPLAQSRLGSMYARGEGVSRDLAEAAKWSRRAADQGALVAQNYLGFAHENGWGILKSDAEAVKWYRKAAEQGYAVAQCNLGQMYQRGGGVERDYKEAVNWYLEAAEQDNLSAQHSLGFMYQNGLGVAKDETEAVKWYRQAAQQEHAGAQYSLGFMYQNGQGVAKDETEAVKWFRKAADNGFAMAQTKLGFMYERGRGVPKDDAEAVKWYRKAAQHGDAQGQYNLGLSYELGQGVVKDRQEAVRWLRKAAAQGHADAQKRLQALEGSK